MTSNNVPYSLELTMSALTLEVFIKAMRQGAARSTPTNGIRVPLWPDSTTLMMMQLTLQVRMSKTRIRTLQSCLVSTRRA